MTPSDPKAMDRLTREILHYEDMAMTHAEEAVKFKIEIGKRLLKAKEVLPHGEFLPWCKKTFGWSRSHVARHMMLARNVERLGHLPENASLRMALSAIEGPKAEASPRAEHSKFVIQLISGEEAVVELRTGDVEQLCATFQARELTYRRVDKAA